MPIPGILDGDVLRLSAFVRAVDRDGGGSITLSVGPSYGLGRNRVKCTSASSTSWTYLSVQDTISLGPGDTVWVALSSFHTEVIRRQGRFDLVSLTRIQHPGDWRGKVAHMTSAGSTPGDRGPVSGAGR